jgi:cation-transporting ATPase E
VDETPAAPTGSVDDSPAASTVSVDDSPVASTVSVDDGLDAAAVAQRVAEGRVNVADDRSSRTVAEIVRANTFTLFNAILGTMLVIVLAIGDYKDALFGVVLVANMTIGIVQELRAKRTLDRLVVLAAPRAVVVRDGTATEIPADGIVVDDVVELRLGDQVPVDGVVLRTDALELDEGLLTGESDPVDKPVGDEVLSGSMVVAGSGRIRATHVGADAYARKIAAEARRFTLSRSDLRAGINKILVIVSWALLPTSALLLFNQLRENESVADALSGTVAGVVGMVPEGLVLLTSAALAVAVLRLGRRRTLVQEMPAVEMLARVDVVCLDKTGTLTEGDIAFDRVVGLDGADGEVLERARAGLGALAQSDPNPNASQLAIAQACPAPEPAWRRTAFVPFSSARKWSAAGFDGNGTWVLGAPENVLAAVAQPVADAALGQARVLADDGTRVLVLARADAPLAGETLPDGLVPVGFVLLTEKIRPDAAGTLAFFDQQGVTCKVISGDSPATVGAIARKVGVRDADSVCDARTLPDPDDGDDALAAFDEAVDAHAVFGRVTPHQKREMVHALQRLGHTVAMTGDGVNDALALKDADIGVAMGSGSQATRAVAQLVLLDSSFAVLPEVVAEGRRIIANVERVASLFLTKTVYVFLFVLATGLIGLAFPFLPRHFTLVSAFTIGTPAFILSFAPNARRARPGFLGRVLRIAVPAGVVIAAMTTAAYYETSVITPVRIIEQTAATAVLVTLAFWVLSIVMRPFKFWKGVLLAAMVAGVVTVFVTPPLRAFFALEPLPTTVLQIAALTAVVGIGLLEGSVRLVRRVARRRAAAASAP